MIGGSVEGEERRLHIEAVAELLSCQLAWHSIRPLHVEASDEGATIVFSPDNVPDRALVTAIEELSSDTDVTIRLATSDGDTLLDTSSRLNPNLPMTVASIGRYHLLTHGVDTASILRRDDRDAEIRVRGGGPLPANAAAEIADLARKYNVGLTVVIDPEQPHVPAPGVSPAGGDQ